MSWDGPTAAWWRDEVAGDPAYERDVDVLLDDLLSVTDGGRTVDLGCGDGRLLARYSAIGVDGSRQLASIAKGMGSVVVGDVRRLPFAASSFDRAFAVLVIEHVSGISAFFSEAARVVRDGGVLALVVNHPTYTAPGSGPFVDPDDGEVLWRWGDYLTTGSSIEPAGNDTIEFHHRSMGDLLSTAALAGWDLETVSERSLTPGDDPLLAVQVQLPRLLGVRWRRRPEQRSTD